MNKVVVVVLGWVLLSLASASAVAAPKVTLGAAVGGPNLAYVDIPLWLQDSTPTAATLQFDVQFNDAQLTFASATSLAALGDHELDSNVISSGNTLRIIITPPVENSAIPSGKIATLRFNLPSGAVNGSQTLHLTQFETFTAQAVAVAGIATLDGFIADASNTVADTDSDGIHDVYEAANGLHPLDLADAAQDFDNDDLTNLAEYQLGTNIYLGDTDGDGMSDKFETTVAGLNPLVNDANADLDGDGLSNLWEFKLGTSLVSSAGTPAQSTTLSGQITTNTVLLPGTTYQVPASVEVVSGVTLTVGPGAQLVFANGTGVTINGTLNVLGLVDAVAQFTSLSSISGIWKGITFGATSTNSLINFSDIRWAQSAVDVTGAMVDVKNSHISGINYFGIYFKAGAGGLIANNVIEQGGSGAIGIQLQEATPALKGFSTTVSENVIRGMWAGIYINNKTTALVGARNTITKNIYGISVHGSGNAGLDPKPVINGNSIIDNTTANIRADYFGGGVSTIIDATNNWWGSTDVPTIQLGIIDAVDQPGTSVQPIVKFVTFLDGPDGNPTRGSVISPTIASDMTIDTGGVVDVVAAVTLNNGATLTVKAGATVRFWGEAAGLVANGKLLVHGTAANPVNFISGRPTPSAGSWAGIRLNAGATGSVLDNAVIRWARDGLSMTSANATVSNSVIADNNMYGIYMLESSPLITNTFVGRNYYGIWIEQKSNPQIVNGNTITNNTIAGIYVKGVGNSANDPKPTLTGNNIYTSKGSNIYTINYQNAANVVLDATSNWWGTTDLVAIESSIYDYADTTGSPVVRILKILDGAGGNPTMSNGLAGDIAVNTTLSSGATYEVLENTVVPTGTTLTIQPGATLRFYGKATTLRVDGTLVVRGSSANTVKFTSNLATPTQGSWAGLVIAAGSARNDIQYADVQWATNGISVSTSQVLIRNCTIKNFATNGISMLAGVGGVLADNTIDNITPQNGNAGTGIYLTNASPLIRGNSITHTSLAVNIDILSNPTIRSGNVITSNNHGIYMYGVGQAAKDPKAKINYNSIYENSSYNFNSGAYYSPSSVHIDVTNNWWGTANVPTIVSKIYDNTDAPTYSPVADYVPYLSAAPVIAPEPVYPPWDTDGDGMDDAWELQFFSDLSRDGTGDLNGNGISDLQEFLNGTNPNLQPGPGTPTLQAPGYGLEVTTLQPQLVVVNGVHEPAPAVSYQFEVYSDVAMSQLVASASAVAEGTNTTAWTIPAALSDNAWYYWRARGFDGTLYSIWVNGKFFANTANDAPGAFSVSSPIDGGRMTTATPTLQVTNAADIDGDVVYYTFKVVADGGLTTVVASELNVAESGAGTTSWTVTTPLLENTTYYWQVTAIDEHGAESVGTVANFFVNTVNDAPGVPGISAPGTGSKIAPTLVDLVVTNATDPEGDALTYTFELDTVNTFTGAGKQVFSLIPQGLAGTTSVTVSALTENTTYYWRVKASDGLADSAWAQAVFMINAPNVAPPVPTVQNPGNQAWVDSLIPALAVNPVIDPNGDAVSYRFELYADATLTSLVDTYTSKTGEWLMITPLTDNAWYYWRARAEDIHGAASNWSAGSSFFVDDNGYNDVPNITFLEPPGDVVVSTGQVLLRWDDTDPDSSASIALYYATNNTGGNGTLIVGGLEEDPDGTADTYLWNLSGIPNGDYWVYAVIIDGSSTVTTYAPSKITVKTLVDLASLARKGSTEATVGNVYKSFNRATLEATYASTVTNISTQPFNGPVYLVVASITGAGVTVKNAATTTTNGQAVFLISPAGFAVGQVATSTIIFANPSNVRFSFTAAVYTTLPP